MAKVYIEVGHGGKDSGAVKYLVEKDVNLTMALSCEEYLKANGVQVKLSRYKDEDDPLTDCIKECNEYNPDLVVGMHNNAGKGDGFEAFYHHLGGYSKKLAQNIEKEIKAIGQNSRGCKIKLNKNGKDYYGLIRQTKASAVITEGLFVDNAKDVQIADTIEEQKAFGVAYAKGIITTLKQMGKFVSQQTNTQTSTATSTSKGYLVKINTPVLNVRNGAGTNFKINTKVKKGEIYTIVAEKGKTEKDKWGKLKSGAGWIKLSYTIRLK